MTDRKRTQRIIFSLIAVFVVGALTLTWFPLTKTVAVDLGGASGEVRISPRFILMPQGCTTYTWRVDNIQSIWFDNNASVGESSERVCGFVDGPPPLLVQFTDNSQFVYRLSPVIMAQQPLVWLGALLSIVGLLYALIPPRVSGVMLRGAQVVLVWVVLLMLMLEGGFRLWIVTTGTPSQRTLYLGSAEDVQLANQNFVAVPFINYTSSPVRDDVNALGLRNAPVSLDKPADTFRIIAVGGSTTYGDGIEADETWPVRLQHYLHEDYGYTHVEVINAGQPAYQMLNSLVNYQARLTELSPDMVMIYHAANDAAAARFSEDCYRGENMNLGLAKSARWAFDVQQLGPSAFLRFVNISLGRIESPTLHPGVPSNVVFGCDTDTPLNTSVRYFERNLRYLLVALEADAVQPVLSTWAYRDVAQPENALINYHRDYVPLINDAIRAHAETFDVPLIDLAQELPADATYWQADTIHQTPDGTNAQAALYAAALHDAELIPPR